MKRIQLLSVLAALVFSLVAHSARAQAIIGTTTSSDVFHSAARFHVHFANGYYWVAYHDGVTPVLARSVDGISWTALGPVFSSINPSDVGEWAVRYSGINVIAFGRNGGDNLRYYRNGTLNAGGTVTWNAADASSGAGAWPILNAAIVNGKPILWSADATTDGALRIGSQLNGPIWTNSPSSSAWAGATGGGYSAGALFPAGGSDPNDVIVLRAATANAYLLGNHRVLSVKYDASLNAFDAGWYNVSTLGGTLTEDATTEPRVQTDNSVHKRFAAVKDTGGNLHVVYINRNNDVVHYRKVPGFNDTWTRLSTDVTLSASVVDKIAISAAGSNNLYLFYAYTTDEIFYRRFDGAAWGPETFLYDPGTDLNDALAPLESSFGCRTGLAISEGLGSPFNARFLLAGSPDCGALATSQGAGTVTVTSPASFEMTFATQAGGSMLTFYDLVEDPTKLHDLVGALASSTSPHGLHNSGMRVAGTNYNAGTNAVGSRIDPLEVTPTRVRLRQESFYENNATGVLLAGVKGFGDYTVAPSGKLAVRWNRRTTQAVSYETEYHELMIHQAAAPIDNWATYSETDGVIPPNNPGDDDFLLAQKEVPLVRTDFLHVLSRDWTTANGHFGSADLTGWTVNAPAERVNLYWVENTPLVLPAGSSETWNFLTYFKTNALLDNTDPAALERRDDYRGPNSVAVMVGGPWLDASENTGGGDDYNESEAAYALTYDPSLGLTFDIDGGTTTRYHPFFKIRQWRSLQDPPAVSVEGVPLANGIDYHADVKPVSRAHWANTLAWHCTIESGTACDAGSVDVGSTGAQTGVVIVPGKYGNAGEFNANTDAVSAGAAGSSDFSPVSGSVELWYQPYYAWNEGVPPRRVIWMNEGVGSDYFILERTTANELKLTINNNGGVSASSTILAANYSWRANDWVHLRTAWKNTGLAVDRVKIYVNGVAPTQTIAGAWDGIGMNHGPTLFGGCSGPCPGAGNGHANGIIDEPHIFVSADTPSLAAYGGLLGNAGEYFADPARSFGLNFGVVDASKRGRYLFIGADSKFLGLNVALSTLGVGVVDLKWEFWNGATWADLESGFGFIDQTNHLTANGTIYWTGDPFGWSPYSLGGEPDLYYVRASMVSGAYTQTPFEGLIKTDILLFQYCSDITVNAQTFSFAVPIPTAVELVSFGARGMDSAVELTWETGSELSNLGFHLYRATSPSGPFERISNRPIPGLGSSPSGARYRHLDTGLVNGESYFYELEDIEDTGRTERHGPVSAVPTPQNPVDTVTAASAVTFGEPSESSLVVLEQSRSGLLVELRTDGFQAEPLPDGSVRLSVPGFSGENEPGSPAIPRKRSWISIPDGTRVKVVSVRIEDVERFSSLRPEAAPVPELFASGRTVRAGRRRIREGADFRRAGLTPVSAARVVTVGYQGSERKALLELAPLRWDGAAGELVLARRMVVRLSLTPQKVTQQLRGKVGRDRSVVLRLGAAEKGLYRSRFEELFGTRGRSVTQSALRLSRQGKDVAFHLEPENGRFGPGSSLYFFSPGAAINPYGREAVYELETGVRGTTMSVLGAVSPGDPTPSYRHRVEREENHYYQAGLLDAPDVWLWDLLFAPVTKSYSFEASELSAGSPPLLEVWLQGVSTSNHQVRVCVNGTEVAESTLAGKSPLKLAAEIPAGVLREGVNEVSIENAGDTSSPYSMVMLDRFAVEYPRSLDAGLVLDVTDPVNPRWIPDGSSLRVEPGRYYLMVGSELKAPKVERAFASALKSTAKRADYLILGPRELLPSAEPLLALRRRQGLRSVSVGIEEVYAEFGFGESTPESIREFLAYAFHDWRKPAPRYVVLLGDATYDFKDYLETGVANQVPPFLVKTSYLWTASDAAYAAVNGEDMLPDFAIGRLPAKSAAEVRAIVSKIAAYEASGSFGSGRAVLVADDPDAAGNFEAGAEEIAEELLASRDPRRVYLRRLGVEGTREAIVESFGEDPALVSYMGHGGIHLWAQENLLDTSSVPSLPPRGEWPLVVTLNCLNGYFHFPYFDSLGEALVKAEGRGAVASISPSGLSLNEPAHLFHKALLSELLSGSHERLGDAVAAAQAAYADSGAFPELLRIYVLLGDPALRLR